jgi:predicted small secreted protein
VGGIVEKVMKKYLTVAAVLALSGGVAVAQSSNTNPKGIGADVRTQAHAQHDSTDKGLGADVSAQAKSQRTAPTPTPSPSPSPTPTPTPTGSAPTGPSAQ